MPAFTFSQLPEGCLAGSGAIRSFVCLVLVACLTVGAPPAQAGSGIKFEPFSAERYDSARQSGAPFVLEFTADWCVPCRELEQKTLADPTVIREAQGIRFISVDMTKPDRRTELLIRSFKIPGAPTTIVYGADGKERTRRVGFIDAREFAKMLAEAKAAASSSSPPSPAPPAAIRNI
jgi:thiol:disulfide interchange protein DsbD